MMMRPVILLIMISHHLSMPHQRKLQIIVYLQGQTWYLKVQSVCIGTHLKVCLLASESPNTIYFHYFMFQPLKILQTSEPNHSTDQSHLTLLDNLYYHLIFYLNQPSISDLQKQPGKAKSIGKLKIVANSYS